MFAKGFGMMKGDRSARRGFSSLIGAALLFVFVVNPVHASMAQPSAKTRTDVSKAVLAGEPVDAAVADFNGDRHLDIVQAISGGGLTVRWGIQKGVYADPVVIDAPTVNATRVLGVDVTADGRADVIAYAAGGTTLWVLPSGGDSGFLPARSTHVDAGIKSVAMGDFDRNGGIDLAVAPVRTNTLVFLMTRDNRSGFDLVTTPVDFAPLSVASLPLDRGAAPDLVVGTKDNSLVTMLNVSGSFVSGEVKKVGFSPDHLAAVDLNADGLKDVVAASTLGHIATCMRVAGGIADPVDSGVEGALGRMTIGYADDDSRPDIIGSGAGTAIVYAGLDGGLFAAPREAVRYADVTAVAVAPGAQGRQNDLVVSRKSGLSIDHITAPLTKLRAQLQVTDPRDIRWTCPLDMNGDATTTLVPTGSLRDVVNTANGSGSAVIVFNALTPTVAFYDGGYSPASLVTHIILIGTIDITGADIELRGETVQDTNPFGPDIAIQPLDNQAWRAALQDVAPTPPLLPFDALRVDGTGCVISSMIIAGGNFGGFPSVLLPKCSNPSTTTATNVVGNTFNNGITIYGGNCTVQGCYVGTDQRGFGTAPGLPISLVAGGIAINAGGCTIGGPDLADRNVIVGSTDGVRVYAGDGNVIQNNIIGSDGTIGGRPGGITPQHGVSIQNATGTVIEANTIGGSSLSGILLTEGCDNTTISTNRIGVDSFGGNSGNNQNSDGGILINASTDTSIGPNNIISQNVGIDAANSGGIVITGSSVTSDRTTIADNDIESNVKNGVYIELGNDSTVGPNNLIKANSAFGVAVVSGTGNTITQNSITENSTLGINLVSPSDPSSGITPNDTDDSDSGPNNLINYPVFLSSVVDTTTVTVAGTAPAGSVVEIFKSDTKHANGEGVEFMIATTATSGGAFSVALPVTLPLDENLSVTATATDSGGNTSEFSPNFTLNQRLNVSPSSITFPTTAVGGTTTRDVTICNNGVSNLTISSIAVTPAGGPFAVTGAPEGGVTLAPGECITVTVSFSPTSASNFSGSLIITSDDPNNPTFTVPLGGTAILASIIINVSSVNFPQVAVGGDRTASVTVTNPTVVPVTINRIDFHRRGSRKVSFTDPSDPFFSASPSTFTLPPNGSQQVLLTFHPRPPAPSPDTSAPFVLPTPGYQLPKKLKTDVIFVVSDTLGITASVVATAKVRPDPGITGGNGSWTGDRIDLAVDTYDPDNNLTNAQFVFFNDSFVELFRINNTPGVQEAFHGVAKGINVPLTFTFTGLLPFENSLKFLDATLIDGTGVTASIRFAVEFQASKDGRSTLVLTPISAPGYSAVPYRGTFGPGFALPPIKLSPRQ